LVRNSYQTKKDAGCLTSKAEWEEESGNYHGQRFPCFRLCPVLLQKPQNLIAKPFFSGSKGKLLRGPSG
jgi:hypothetical protein